MTNNDIIVLFKEAVREVDANTKLDDLTTSTEIAKLGLDSVMTMEVIGVLEERLNVRFPDEDLATLKNIGDLTALIQRMAA
jgi:acyl carrier protein